MTAIRTYLDWNATAPLRPEARVAMVKALDLTGNPSSIHAEGRHARAVIDDAREQVAALVGARASDVVFTSGATEANATVMAAGWSTIFVSDIEHESVVHAAKATRARIIEIPVGRDGVVEVGAIADEVLTGTGSSGRTLLTLQHANNETGAIQPVAEVAAFARAHGLAVHTDAVQTCGRLPVDVAALGVDYLSLSAHKLGGPKGIGALILRDGAPLPNLLLGGGQERRRRAGTENIAGIAGFGAAAVAAKAEIANIDRQRARRDLLEHHIRSMSPKAVIVAETVERLPNTTCVAVSGITSETLVIKLDLAGFAISAGSACSSGKVGASHVLRAMGTPPDLARAAIRISIGASTTDAEIDRFLTHWTTITRTAAKAA
jgi:cysteine desulfurase